ncbi:MAG: FAD-binding oxidoreductase [Candidatus Neomarinimicrobiota bacterium]
MAVTDVELLEKKLGQVFSNDQLSPSNSHLSTHFTAHPVEPGQVSELVKLAGKEKLTLLPIGGATRLYKAGKSMDVAVSLSNLAPTMEHSPEDLTVTVVAGMAFTSVQEKLLESGQMIPLDPPSTTRSTIGGIVAANAFGPRRHRYGSARDWVTETVLVNDRGSAVRSGAKVVKNVSGYDLNKLYIGSRGTLGILLNITLKLNPVPQNRVYFTSRFPSVESALNMANRIRNHSLSVESLTIISGEWSPNPGEDWTLLLELGGSQRSLQKQETIVHSFSDGSGQDFIRASEDETRVIRERINRVDGSDRYRVRISFSKRQLKSFLQTGTLRKTEAVSAKIFPGIGICYVELPGNSDRPDRWLREIIGEVRSRGGSAEFESLPDDAPFERWPLLPASFPWMKKIKEGLDPQGIFAPGTFVGGI